MEAVNFDGTNTVFARDQPEYRELPAYLDENGKLTAIFELDEQDLENVLTTRQIRIDILTFNQPLQPILLSSSPARYELTTGGK